MEKYILRIPKKIVNDLERYEKILYKGTEFNQELLKLKDIIFDLGKKIDLAYRYKNIDNWLEKVK